MGSSLLADPIDMADQRAAQKTRKGREEILSGREAGPVLVYPDSSSATMSAETKTKAKAPTQTSPRPRKSSPPPLPKLWRQFKESDPWSHQVTT